MSLLDWVNPLKIFLDPIEKVSDAISRAQIAKAQAQTDEKRMQYDERIEALKAKREVLINESPDSVNAKMRAFLAMPVGILLWKILVWDKALGQWTGGRTDALSSDIWNVVMAVVGFYFLYQVAALWKRKS